MSCDQSRAGQLRTQGRVPKEPSGLISLVGQFMVPSREHERQGPQDRVAEEGCRESCGGDEVAERGAVAAMGLGSGAALGSELQPASTLHASLVPGQR